ncbi:AraC family transcriptional regulator [Acinetobacter sp. ME22]|uniref:helix-turn-helix transcriptional regulator n=1 Tax=Acinetobacter sp. ME22 TaxID=2904802 RepID=UPI001EDC64D9|nr:AraC family transcriptional regulator [Acinetobacter sp. ME22]MCG2573157.1 AraC family transcriptional regulator [Acinetobacter sp. ME22]
MDHLIGVAKKVIKNRSGLPFSVYSSYKEQKISNVPILKPLLIFILSGSKQLGHSRSIACSAGSFVFLSNSDQINIRNVPMQQEYFAVLIDFENEDFSELPKSPEPYKKYVQGEINPILASALCQFMEFALIAPTQIMRLRKREILEIIYHSGHQDITHLVKPPSLTIQVQSMILNDISNDWSVDLIASNLCMSASTLRRKLKSEGYYIQDIRHRARLGYGLHLLQTTQLHIGMIAEQCGYQSQSRFTEQFKRLFGMTPRAIRKTKHIE